MIYLNIPIIAYFLLAYLVVAGGFIYSEYKSLYYLTEDTYLMALLWLPLVLLFIAALVYGKSRDFIDHCKATVWTLPEPILTAIDIGVLYPPIHELMKDYGILHTVLEVYSLKDRSTTHKVYSVMLPYKKYFCSSIRYGYFVIDSDYSTKPTYITDYAKDHILLKSIHYKEGIESVFKYENKKLCMRKVSDDCDVPVTIRQRLIETEHSVAVTLGDL